MGYRILVIEDDKDIQELVCEFLKIQDYEVETADDGTEGMLKFQNSEFDLIILDAMLPKLNGFQLLQMIRSKSQIPILMMTALDEEMDLIKGFDLGADDYVTKPFSFNVLIKRVEAILRRAKPHKQSTVQMYKDLVADQERFLVTMAGEPLEITAKEFEILFFLMENQGKVLTREILLDKLWGIDFFGNTRIVDAHIKNLRKKLQGRYVRTIKGVGYTLDD